MKNNLKALFLFIFFLILMLSLNTHLNLNVSYEDRIQKCKSPSKTNSQQCWGNTIKQIFKEKGAKGVEEGLKFLDIVYNSDPEISDEDCHALAHEIGKEAYRFFLKKQTFNLTPAISNCGYGFFHAFIASLTEEGKEIEIAKKFCEKAEKELSPESLGVRENCYHGIGHGLVPDPPGENLQADWKGILSPSLLTCSEVSQRKTDVEACLDGSFNAIALLMAHQSYGLSFNKNNIFALCDDLNYSKSINTICYHQMANQLNSISEVSDIGRQAEYILKIEDRNLAYTTIFAISRHIVSRKKDQEIHSLIGDCRKLPEKFRLGCLNGLTRGYAVNRSSRYLFQKAVSFCKLEILTEKERDNCFRYQFHFAKNNLPEEKIQALCPTVDKKYRSYCEDKNFKYTVN